MDRRKTNSRISAIRLVLLAGLAFSAVALAGDMNKFYSAWLGREITIVTSPIDDQIPVGGKLTFVYDPDDEVVRVCTRNGSGQRGLWRMDLAAGCNVTLLFTQGTRYCTIEDVKAGDGEVLSQCHRLRSREVALSPSTSKGSVDLKDMLVFLLATDDGKPTIAILVDTSARVTGQPIIIGHG